MRGVTTSSPMQSSNAWLRNRAMPRRHTALCCPRLRCWLSSTTVLVVAFRSVLCVVVPHSVLFDVCPGVGQTCTNRFLLPYVAWQVMLAVGCGPVAAGVLRGQGHRVWRRTLQRKSCNTCPLCCQPPWSSPPVMFSCNDLLCLHTRRRLGFGWGCCPLFASSTAAVTGHITPVELPCLQPSPPAWSSYFHHVVWSGSPTSGCVSL